VNCEVKYFSAPVFSEFRSHRPPHYTPFKIAEPFTILAILRFFQGWGER